MEVEATYDRLESKDKDNSESQRAARCTFFVLFFALHMHVYTHTHSKPVVIWS